MVIKVYVNCRNQYKFIEVHNDGHYHNYVKPFLKYPNGVVNKLGDGCFHRWHKSNLEELLEDYILVE